MVLKDYTTVKAVNANLNSQFAQLVFVTQINSQVSTTTNLKILNDVNKVLFCSGMFSYNKASDFVKYLQSEILPVFNTFKEKGDETVATQSVSAADEIKKFKDLLDSGIITQGEFDAKKKQLLGI